MLGQTDICIDPINQDTQYCRDRLPGETIAQWQERRIAELAAEKPPLEVTITRGIESIPAWGWWTAGILLGALVLGVFDDG